MKYEDDKLFTFMHSNERLTELVLKSGFTKAGITSEERKDINADAFCIRMFYCGMQYSDDIASDIVNSGVYFHGSVDKAFMTALSFAAIVMGGLSTDNALKFARIFFDAGI